MIPKYTNTQEEKILIDLELNQQGMTKKKAKLD